ncbi:MAG TPA: hypothetical protein VOA88_12900, partial [Candidatus Dormibacteraeota bacterium]|nr:hypothetical protein [Candidatus Dormibacteraeota bacterium]
MATLMAGIKTEGGKFIEKSIEIVKGRPQVPAKGETVTTAGNSKSAGVSHVVEKVTRYFVQYRKEGSRVNSDSYPAL